MLLAETRKGNISERRPHRPISGTQRPPRPNRGTQRPPRPTSGTKRPPRPTSGTQRPPRQTSGTKRSPRPSNGKDGVRKVKVRLDECIDGAVSGKATKVLGITQSLSSIQSHSGGRERLAVSCTLSRKDWPELTVIPEPKHPAQTVDRKIRSPRSRAHVPGVTDRSRDAPNTTITLSTHRAENGTDAHNDEMTAFNTNEDCDEVIGTILAQINTNPFGYTEIPDDESKASDTGSIADSASDTGIKDDSTSDKTPDSTSDKPGITPDNKDNTASDKKLSKPASKTIPSYVNNSNSYPAKKTRSCLGPNDKSVPVTKSTSFLGKKGKTDKVNPISPAANRLNSNFRKTENETSKNDKTNHPRAPRSTTHAWNKNFNKSDNIDPKGKTNGPTPWNYNLKSKTDKKDKATTSNTWKNKFKLPNCNSDIDKKQPTPASKTISPTAKHRAPCPANKVYRVRPAKSFTDPIYKPVPATKTTSFSDKKSNTNKVNPRALTAKRWNNNFKNSENDINKNCQTSNPNIPVTHMPTPRFTEHVDGPGSSPGDKPVDGTEIGEDEQKECIMCGHRKENTTQKVDTQQSTHEVAKPNEAPVIKMNKAQAMRAANVQAHQREREKQKQEKRWKDGKSLNDIKNNVSKVDISSSTDSLKDEQLKAVNLPENSTSNISLAPIPSRSDTLPPIIRMNKAQIQRANALKTNALSKASFHVADAPAPRKGRSSSNCSKGKKKKVKNKKKKRDVKLLAYTSLGFEASVKPRVGRTPPPKPPESRTTAPRRSESRTTAPCRSKSRTTTPSRSKGRTTGPRRSESRTTTPSRSESRTTAPSRSESRITAPRRSESRTTAPSRSKSRSTAPRRSESRITAPRRSESRTTAPRRSKSRTTAPRRSESRTTAPRRSESRTTTSSRSESRTTAPRRSESRTTAPRRSESRTTEPRRSESHTTAPRRSESRTTAPRRSESRTTAPRRSESRTTAPRRSESRTTAPRRSESRTTAPRRSESRTTTSSRSESHTTTPRRSESRTTTSSRSESRTTAPRFTPPPTPPESRTTAPKPPESSTTSPIRAPSPNRAPSPISTRSLRSATSTSSTTSLSRARSPNRALSPISARSLRSATSTSSAASLRSATSTNRARSPIQSLSRAPSAKSSTSRTPSPTNTSSPRPDLSLTSAFLKYIIEDCSESNYVEDDFDRVTLSLSSTPRTVMSSPTSRISARGESSDAMTSGERVAHFLNDVEWETLSKTLDNLEEQNAQASKCRENRTIAGNIDANGAEEACDKWFDRTSYDESSRPFTSLRFASDGHVDVADDMEACDIGDDPVNPNQVASICASQWPSSEFRKCVGWDEMYPQPRAFTRTRTRTQKGRHPAKKSARRAHEVAMAGPGEPWFTSPSPVSSPKMSDSNTQCYTCHDSFETNKLFSNLDEPVQYTDDGRLVYPSPPAIVSSPSTKAAARMDQHVADMRNALSPLPEGVIKPEETARWRQMLSSPHALKSNANGVDCSGILRRCAASRIRPSPGSTYVAVDTNGKLCVRTATNEVTSTPKTPTSRPPARAAAYQIKSRPKTAIPRPPAASRHTLSYARVGAYHVTSRPKCPSSLQSTCRSSQNHRDLQLNNQTMELNRSWNS